jgi:hypothetical protein
MQGPPGPNLPGLKVVDANGTFIGTYDNGRVFMKVGDQFLTLELGYDGFVAQTEVPNARFFESQDCSGTGYDATFSPAHGFGVEGKLISPTGGATGSGRLYLLVGTLGPDAITVNQRSSRMYGVMSGEYLTTCETYDPRYPLSGTFGTNTILDLGPIEFLTPFRRE